MRFDPCFTQKIDQAGARRFWLGAQRKNSNVVIGATQVRCEFDAASFSSPWMKFGNDEIDFHGMAFTEEMKRANGKPVSCSGILRIGMGMGSSGTDAIRTV
jgi:hypothetical protein